MLKALGGIGLVALLACFPLSHLRIKWLLVGAVTVHRKSQLAPKLAYDLKSTSSVFLVHGATEEHFIINYGDIARKAGVQIKGKKRSEMCTSVKE